MTLERSMALSVSLLVLTALVAGDFEHFDDVVAERSIDVVTVAELLRDRQALLLVDLRSQEVFERFALPGAVSLDQALENEAWNSNVMLVVYGHENNRSWHRLLQHAEVRFLDHGVEQWLSTILSPTVHRNATASELWEFERVADVSRYFGGVPRITDLADTSFDLKNSLATLERRGCGF